MPTSEAFVVTDRAHRYVAQLRSHFAHEPRGISAKSESDEHLFADFGWGTCSMRAQPQGLLLHAEAPDADKLDRIKRGVTVRLEQMGRRDALAVRWSACQHPEGDMRTGSTE